MPLHKPQKIDQDQIYPCPCPRKRGKLKPIALTDAFGCDRCSLMFQLENDGYHLLQLGGLDTYRRSWQWIGRWQPINEYSHYSYPEKAAIYSLAIVVIALVIFWAFNMNWSGSLPIAIIFFSMLGLLIWRLLVLRHRDF